jgi:Leucine-rich repeat (LRR) protein
MVNLSVKSLEDPEITMVRVEANISHRCFSIRLFTDEVLNRFASLEVLCVRWARYPTQALTDAGLVGLNRLTDLYLRDHFFSTTAIQGLTNLRKLSYWAACDDHVRKLTNLTFLDIGSYKNTMTDAGLRGLRNLSTLHLRDQSVITNEGVSGLTNLTYLNLFGNRAITNEGIMNLVNLKFLELYSSKGINDDGLRVFSNLKTLRLMGDIFISDDGLSDLTGLTSLVLRDSVISDFSLRRLQTHFFETLRRASVDYE